MTLKSLHFCVEVLRILGILHRSDTLAVQRLLASCKGTSIWGMSKIAN